MNLIMYPNEAIQIIAQGKEKQSITIWIDDNGKIKHKVKQQG